MKHGKRVGAVILFFSVFQVDANAEQICRKNTIVETAPTVRFSVRGEIALDHATGFEWTRCPLGHIFKNKGTPDDITDDECAPEGATRTKWTNASSRVNSVNTNGLAGYDGVVSYDWRMPNVKELSTIVERACTDPARNIDIFPETVADYMWSSTLTLPWGGEWYNRAFTLHNNGGVWGTQVDTDPLDWELSGYNNDTDPSKWLRVYAIRDGSL